MRRATAPSRGARTSRSSATKARGRPRSHRRILGRMRSALGWGVLRPLDRDGATVATIGVYGWTLERFLDALRDADVGLLADVRQRRGVRGREYSWANAQRLQRALDDAGIRYLHHKE